tara:strand:- start:130 stop:396 length:267 start_codon:yes stop_codon:yes gene_type:complete
MSLEQLKAFLEKVKADTSLQDKLKAAKSPEDVAGIAKEHGHEFTADKISQLSEEELEAVAGGEGPTKIMCATNIQQCRKTICSICPAK